MDRFTDLDTVRDHVWNRLVDAAEQPDHPYHTLTFGTTGAEEPHLRTVVLREATRSARRLAFHTDRESQKVKQIEANDRVAWHGWAPDSREQVRLYATATVHRDDEVADAMWAAQRASSLSIYVRSMDPGAPLDAPRDALDPAVKGDEITRADVAPGRAAFAVVRTTIDRIDWLHLDPEGHYRARFTFDADANRSEGTWIVP
mgnify:CR=1 FL=1